MGKRNVFIFLPATVCAVPALTGCAAKKAANVQWGQQ